MVLLIAQDANTLYIARYGAGLSTATLVVLITTRYFDRRLKIDVRVRSGLAPFEIDKPSKAIIVDASNTGGREITLGTMTFLLTQADMQVIFPQKTYIRDPPCESYEFAPGKSDLTVAVKADAFSGPLKKEGFSGQVPFKAVFRGVANKTHESEEVLFDVEKKGVFHKPKPRFGDRFRRKKARLKV